MSSPIATSQDASQPGRDSTRRLAQTKRRFGSTHNTGPGCKPKALDNRSMRILVRLHVRTGIPFEKQAIIVRKVDGGVAKGTFRKMLEDAFGAGKDTGLELSQMRPRPRNKDRFDDSQRKAAEINKSRNWDSVSPVENTSPEQILSLADTSSSEPVNFDQYLNQEAYGSPFDSMWMGHTGSTSIGGGATTVTPAAANSPSSQSLSFNSEDFLACLLKELKEKERDAVEHVVRACTAESRFSMITAVTRDTLNFSRRSTISEYAPYRKETGKDQIPYTLNELKLQRGNARSCTERLLSLISVCSTDDEAVMHFQEALSALNDEQKTLAINQGDSRGVTLLHVAVAYGYVQFCRLLIDSWGANLEAKTMRETSVYRFAKHAEREAKNDIPLYAKISLCRQFVRHGRALPKPNLPSQPTQHPKRKASGELPSLPRRGSAAVPPLRPRNNVHQLASAPPPSVAQHYPTAPLHAFSIESNTTGSMHSARPGDFSPIRPTFRYCSPEQRSASPVSISNQSRTALVYQGTTIQPWHTEGDDAAVLQVAAPLPDLFGDGSSNTNQATHNASNPHTEQFLDPGIFFDINSGTLGPNLGLPSPNSEYGPSSQLQRSRQPSPLASEPMIASDIPHPQEHEPYMQPSFGQGPVYMNHPLSPPQRRPTKKTVTLECPTCHQRVTATVDIVVDWPDEQLTYGCINRCSPYRVQKSLLLSAGGNVVS